ncbi:response regulator [Deltaproteobacteria bacterium TL4]
MEDNLDNQYTIKAILDETGYQCFIADNGEQALQMAKEMSFKLMLMDIQLPGISGYELTQRFKADPKLQPIPIVALTAKAMAGDREKCIEIGCSDYLSKPIDPMKLIKVLKKWAV